MSRAEYYKGVALAVAIGLTLAYILFYGLSK